MGKKTKKNKHSDLQKKAREVSFFTGDCSEDIVEIGGHLFQIFTIYKRTKKGKLTTTTELLTINQVDEHLNVLRKVAEFKAPRKRDKHHSILDARVYTHSLNPDTFIGANVQPLKENRNRLLYSDTFTRDDELQLDGEVFYDLGAA